MYSNVFQKLGKEIITQLKQQKKNGKTGPFKLQKVKKHKKGGDSDSEDERKFSNITAQLAWERDIDLSKGQAFAKDPCVIENRNAKQAGIGNSAIGNGSVDKKAFGQEENTIIPNGNANSARTIKRVVKKPNGTPRSSPKTPKHVSINRVTPLPFYKQEDDPLEFALTETEAEDNKVKGQSSLSSYSDLYNSIQMTRASVDMGNNQFITVKSDDRYVNNISPGSFGKSEQANSVTVKVLPKRTGSADSKAIDQWVDEIMEDSREPSPSKSDISGSPSRPRSRSKKRKKEKRERKNRDNSGMEKKDNDSSRSKERKSKRKGNKTPTSEEMLINDSDVGESAV